MAQPCRISLVFTGQETRLLRDSLSKGADPNQKNEDGIPALYLAIQSGYSEVVDILIEAGAVLDNPLFVDICINLNDTDMAIWLIQNGILSQLTHTKILEFYFWASACNLVHAIPAFLHNGVDVDSRDENGFGAIHNAIISSKGTTNMVEVLLVVGANPNLKCGEIKNHCSPLHLAAIIANPEQSFKITKLLLEAGAECDIIDDLKHTPLHFAAQFHNNETVQLLLSVGASINFAGGWMDRTPLMFAIIAKNKKAFDILIDAKCDIHVLDRDNTSAVGHAVFAHSSYRSPYMLWTLLMLGGNPNSGAGIWKYPLHTDIYYGEGKFSKMLIFFGADVNVEGVRYGSALALAGQSSCTPEITTMLLDAGADVSGGCRDALSWIVNCCHTGSEEHAQILLEAGADVYGDRKDFSILQEAIMLNRSKLIHMLFNHGASVDMVRYAPINPLGHIRDGGYTTIVNLDTLEVVLKHGAKINNKDIRGMETTPLHTAAREASLSHVKMLIKAGADPTDTCLKYFMTPLHYVAGSGRPSVTESWRFDPGQKPSSAVEIVELLLANHANPLAIDKLGRLPLHYASGSGKTEVVKLLLQSGGFGSARIADKSGTTPLHLATTPEIVVLLIENGGMVSARDKLGRNTLQTAMRRGAGDVLGELLLYSSNEEIRSWQVSPRGSDSIALYIFNSVTARFISFFRSMAPSMGNLDKATPALALNVLKRREEEEICAMSWDKVTIDEDGRISLTTIRIILFMLLVAIMVWRLL